MECVIELLRRKKHLHLAINPISLISQLVLLELNGRVLAVRSDHYVNVSVLIKFSQKASVFTLIIISSP